MEGKFTDFTLICEGERIEVHRVMVCSHSKVLRAACTGSFKASHLTALFYIMVKPNGISNRKHHHVYMR